MLLSQALVYSVKAKSLEIIKILLSWGANAKFWDPETKRPIIDCAFNQRSAFFKLLHGYVTTQIEQLLVDNGAIENVLHIWDDL